MGKGEIIGYCYRVDGKKEWIKESQLDDIGTTNEIGYLDVDWHVKELVITSYKVKVLLCRRNYLEKLIICKGIDHLYVGNNKSLKEIQVPNSIKRIGCDKHLNLL